MPAETVPCVYCGRCADTRDHILPKSWGGDAIWLAYARVWNFVPACRECNEMRAICGHCPGAMAALRHVAGPGSTFGFQRQVAMLWGWRGARTQALVAASLGFDVRDNVHEFFMPMDRPASDIRPAGIEPGRARRTTARRT